MPFLNFESRHFTAAEKTAIDTTLQTLQTALNPKLATLTPEERQQYGSVNEQNKLIINKTKDYHDAQPQLQSPEVDWVEFDEDYGSRAYLQNLAESLIEISRGLENAKILHDWDNYQACLIDYQYTNYRNDSGSPGFHTKAAEIKQFFSRSGTTSPPPAAPPVEEPNV